jgi:hypothetical protein
VRPGSKGAVLTIRSHFPFPGGSSPWNSLLRGTSLSPVFFPTATPSPSSSSIVYPCTSPCPSSSSIVYPRTSPCPSSSSSPSSVPRPPSFSRRSSSASCLSTVSVLNLSTSYSFVSTASTPDPTTDCVPPPHPSPHATIMSSSQFTASWGDACWCWCWRWCCSLCSVSTVFTGGVAQVASPAEGVDGDRRGVGECEPK